MKVICQRCGAYVDKNCLVCEKCGTLLSRAKGSAAAAHSIRQGRASAQQPKSNREGRWEEAAVYGDFDLQLGTPQPMPPRLKSNRSRHNRKLRSFERDAGRPGVRRGIPAVTQSMPANVLHRSHKQHNPTARHAINWAKIIVGIAAAVLLFMAGGYIYLSRSLPGQIIMARYGKASDSHAVWIVGEDYFNDGYIQKAVETFEMAREMDLKKAPPIDNIDGLLLLGAAYEADERKVDAQTLYKLLYETIVPTRPEPYRNAIRMMLDRGEDREAGELMLKAYEKTAVLTFRQQRMDLLPKPPETNLSAGRYIELKTVEFTSPQGYDIYYAPDAQTILPEGGTLYTEPIPLTEGVTTFNVVCVSGRLISDPMTTSYTIYLPSPSSPKARLAPGAYSRRQKVHLYSIDKLAKGEVLRYFYTLDGSEPNVNDSPEYKGEAIALPTGNVTLKAIAVNSLDKNSFGMEVNYRIDVKPYPQKVYDNTDVFSTFELMKTDLEAFEAQFGKGDEAAQTEVVRGFDEPCRRFVYEWGSILVGQEKVKKRWMLIRVESNKELGSFPRGIAMQASSEDIIAKFRDGTQPAGASGIRGLYYSDAGMGRYFPLEGNSAMVKYTCRHQDGNTLSLELYLTDNRLTSFKHGYSFD